MNPAEFLHKQLAYFLGMPVDRRVYLFRTPSLVSSVFPHDRARIILRRTEVLAWIFMLLVALWIIVDMAVFPNEIADALIVGRLVAVVGLSLLLALSLTLVRHASWAMSYLTLMGLLAIPSLFAVYTQPIFLHWQHQGGTFSPVQLGAISLYRQLPVIYIVGLALFPMTLFESIPLMALVIGIMVLGLITNSSSGVVRIDQWADIWTLVVTGGAAALAGVLQFNLLWQNHRLEHFETDTGLMKAEAALGPLLLHWRDRGHKAKLITLAMIEGKTGPEATTTTAASQRADRDRTARIVDLLRRPMPEGIQAVRWSDNELGLIAVGTGPEVVTAIVDEICSQEQALTGQRPRHAVVNHKSGEGSPQNMLRMAEKALRKSA